MDPAGLAVSMNLSRYDCIEICLPFVLTIDKQQRFFIIVGNSKWQVHVKPSWKNDLV
jgi:hypothetical protein